MSSMSYDDFQGNKPVDAGDKEVTNDKRVSKESKRKLMRVSDRDVSHSTSTPKTLAEVSSKSTPAVAGSSSKNDTLASIMETGFSNLENLVTTFIQANNADYEGEELYCDDVGPEDPHAGDGRAADADDIFSKFALASNLDDCVGTPVVAS